MNHRHSHRTALADHLAFLACVVLVAPGVSACANGGGNRIPRDSGVVTPHDSSTHSDGDVDAFVPPPDSGVDTGPNDAGITLMDAGADTSVVDSGPIDSGVLDTGPAPECATSVDCSDGLACTGSESCVGGHCVAGTAIACSDSVACTRDSCSEPGGSCTHTADNTSCGASEICDPSAGCVPSSSCSESPCRLVAPQCGCPTGQGCYLTSGTRVCLTSGTTAVGARCDTTQCTPGAICVNLAATGTPVALCHRVCATDSDCPGAGALCVGGIAGSSDKTCSVDCNPATQVGCPSGTACSFFIESAGAMRTLTDCSAPVGTGSQNASCADDTDCQKGYACIDATGTGAKQCLHWCRRPAGSECSFGTSCYGFTPPLVWSGTEYGVCD